MKKLNEQNDIAFSWGDLKNDITELKHFLTSNYNVEWINNIGNVELKTSDDNIAISERSNTDERPSNSGPLSYFSIRGKSRRDNIISSDQTLSISLEDERSKAILRINNKPIDEFKLSNMNGKTNLHLKDKEILTVWFNAWRYEREDKYTLIALLKTIVYAIGDLPYYREIKRILQNGIAIATKGAIRNLAAKYVMTEKSFDELVDLKI